MAKKATKAEETVEVAPQPTSAKTAPVQNTPVKPSWEIKDRLYLLKGNKKPVIFTLPAKHSAVRPLLWFNPETGEQKEIRVCYKPKLTLCRRATGNGYIRSNYL